MTVLVNGVVVQDSTPLDGGGGWRERKAVTTVYPEQDRIRLQDHGNPVRYRNVWVRSLRPRPVDGGTDGRISAEATTAKRAEIAAEVRASAADLLGCDRMMRILEAYMYDNDPAAWSECDALVSAYVAGLQVLSSDELEKQRHPVTQLRNALTFLQRFSMIPKTYAPEQELKDLAGQQGWLKK